MKKTKAISTYCPVMSPIAESASESTWMSGVHVQQSSLFCAAFIELLPIQVCYQHLLTPCAARILFIHEGSPGKLPFAHLHSALLKTARW